MKIIEYRGAYLEYMKFIRSGGIYFVSMLVYLHKMMEAIETQLDKREVPCRGNKNICTAQQP